MTIAAHPTTRPRRRRLSWRTIRAIMRREFIDVRRDRRSLILTFLYPISMLIMYVLHARRHRYGGRRLRVKPPAK